MINLLSILIIVPLFGALVLLFIPRSPSGDRAVRWIALATVLVDFALSVWLFVNFQNGTPDMQFVERLPWIQPLGIAWYVGVDGLSILLVVLTTFLMIIAIGGRGPPSRTG